MFSWWYCGFIGYIFLCGITCQDTDEAGDSDTVVVNLAINTLPKSVDETAKSESQRAEEFSCYECWDCHLSPEMRSLTCNPGVNRCYKISKVIDGKSQVIRRGCSESRDNCLIPHQDPSITLDSRTCCTSPKCNQGIQLHPFFSLFIIGLFTFIIFTYNY